MNPAISRRDLLRSAAVLFPATRLLAWQDETKTGDPKYSGGVSVVNVLATVRDKQGKLATNLIQDDFSIEEDGHPQIIRYFARQTDLPLTLGLLVDTSMSERREIEPERRASRIFFDQVLRQEKDKAFVLHFDHDVELLQDLTSSKPALNASLNDLQVGQAQLNRRNSGQQPGGNPQGSPQGRGRGGIGGTALYDAIYLASNDVIKKQPGRKALILLSDGEDRNSKVSLTSAIEAAQRADAGVYSIRFYDRSAGSGRGGGFGRGGGRRGGVGGGPFPGGGNREDGKSGGNREDGKKILQQMASETGGSYYEVSGKMTIDRIYERIEEELRSQYSLGYTSDQTVPGYRKIHVGVKIKNLTVQTREGYYV
jgi:VWFA-related protein